jgi:uncharacterized Zn finger protein
VARFDYGGWPKYVSAAERRKKAESHTAKLRKKGRKILPVVIKGRAIATTFWGKAWCETLESYRDYENRLPRGRTYARNGSVVDLQIEPLEVKALVSGSSMYEVTIAIKTVTKKSWQSICQDCAGGIDSLVELLQGKFSKAVMERLCRSDSGLFPKSSEIKFSCSCPDYASMCKHIAAVLYGIGARLDENPELLFRLRAVDERDLIADLDSVLSVTKNISKAKKILKNQDVSELFGIEMDVSEERPRAKVLTASKPKKAVKRKSSGTAGRKAKS